MIIANPSDTQPAWVSSATIEESELRENTGPQDSAERMIGFYMDKPILSQFGSVSATKDPNSGRSLENWATIDQACNRLCQQLSWTGANSLVLKVQADGGSIVPLNLLGSSTAYDNGCFFSDGRCPQKDTVALLLRYCEKYGIRLVLAFDFDVQLPELADAEAIYQKHLRIESSSPRRQSKYDPLNAEVQAAYRSVVQNVTERYRTYSAFAGLLLQLDRESNLVYQGDQWGYSEVNVQNFASAISSPAKSGDRKVPRSFSIQSGPRSR